MNSSNQMPSEMEYVKYMNLGFEIAVALLHATTIFFTFHLIYCSKFVETSTKLNRISNSFIIFLAGRGFGAVIATPYQVYLAAYWSAEVRNCQLVPCVLLKYRLLIPQHAKLGIGGLNVLGSCYLMFAIKRNNSEKLKNDVVKFTTIMDIFFDVIPTFGNFIFTVITGFSQAVYTGHLIAIFYFLNVAVCSIYYWWRLTRRSNSFGVKICRIQQFSRTTTAV
ncbi:hypothetical protein DdX_17094 [Ditylenchus destructor]|uniref:Uncharacterized protein n=1 Tax=Ditylenchus destructor TaxID=166010 RepID=A0AAD4QTM4_9BILA|nr:hypothetical protein DdX_17094 [Ditylenchus destructor]